jgi:putative Mg2+ transporter-C (MgtC) family protein
MSILLLHAGSLTTLSVLIRLLLAVLFGGAIGLERGQKRRAAGLRTYILVTLGATIAMLTDLYLLKTVNQNADPARFGAQVIAGVGIFCAGTIMVTRNKQIKGLTTAAGLWASACLGLSIGAGFYVAAALGFLIILATMSFFHKFEADLMKNSVYISLSIEIIGIHNASRVVEHLRGLGASISALELNQSENSSGVDSSLLISLKFPERFSHEELIEKLDALDGVLYIEEL